MDTTGDFILSESLHRAPTPRIFRIFLPATEVHGWLGRDLSLQIILLIVIICIIENREALQNLAHGYLFQRYSPLLNIITPLPSNIISNHSSLTLYLNSLSFNNFNI
ncbi:hypothetical protein SAMN05421545_2746 [Pontibacter lucknowensis]|uniref:Uncharacterized protein n=1 Tax=Pontibacter lucknowensis TaxID=1077936 RepID=A0A1N6Z4L7_9BACT|nr:hypothetical protein SAMN05421545_2746 [Pontibacter lucknowensis]